MTIYNILLAVCFVLACAFIFLVIYFIKKTKNEKDKKKNINNSETHYIKNVTIINKSQSSTSKIDFTSNKIKNTNYVSVQLDDGRRISMIAKDDVYSCVVPGERVDIKYKEYKGSYYLVGIQGIV